VINPLDIYLAYPSSDLLPVGPPKEGETINEYADRSGFAGDTLYTFLLLEAEEPYLMRHEYADRLRTAIRDIAAVLTSFE
jgi:hypothetical protein